jgi:hypothetical protein
MTSPKHDAPAAGSPEHEALCQRCGVSCHAATMLGDGRNIVVEGLHCRFYGVAPDGKPGCTVYTERRKKAPWCLQVDAAKAIGALREGCPYMQGDSSSLAQGVSLRIRGKVRVSPEEYDALWPQVATSLLSAGPVLLVFGWAEFLAKANGRDPDHTWQLRPNAEGTAGELTRTPIVCKKL